MSWKNIIKAKNIDLANPIQYPRENVAKLLRETMNKTKFHKGINGILPELEGTFSYIDKRRGKQYKQLAAEIRKVAMTLRQLITDYEGQEG